MATAIHLARRPCAGAVPGWRGAFLTVRASPAAFVVVSSRHTPCAVTCVLFHLASLLEPLLVLGRFLPAFVRRAGPDQVHIGAEILAVLAGAVAGAVLEEAEILGGKFLGGSVRSSDQVAPLETNRFHDRPRLG